MDEEEPPEREETPAERVDRNLEELLAESRVALPGVQVLFAFLLILPFNQRFTEVTGFERGIYLGALLCAALASLLLIAPSMHHRLLFRTNSKERILFAAHRTAIAGLSILALGMGGAVLLVSSFVFGTLTALLATGLVVAAVSAIWLAMPLIARLNED